MTPAKHLLALLEAQFVEQTSCRLILRPVTRDHHLTVLEIMNHVDELVGNGVADALPLKVAVDGQAVDDPLRRVLGIDQHDEADLLVLQIDDIGGDSRVPRLQIGDEGIPGEAALLRLDAHGAQRHELAQTRNFAKFDFRRQQSSSKIYAGV